MFLEKQTREAKKAVEGSLGVPFKWEYHRDKLRDDIHVCRETRRITISERIHEPRFGACVARGLVIALGMEEAEA